MASTIGCPCISIDDKKIIPNMGTETVQQDTLFHGFAVDKKLIPNVGTEPLV